MAPQALVGLPVDSIKLSTNLLVQDPYALRCALTSSVQSLLDHETQRQHQTNQAGRGSCEFTLDVPANTEQRRENALGFPEDHWLMPPRMKY